MSSVIVGRGNSTLGGWQQYPGGTGVFTDIRTTGGRFPVNSGPTYLTVLFGTSGHWDTTGATSIYSTPGTPRNEGFRVYVKRPDGRGLTPQEANANHWYIEWVGIALQPEPASVVTGSGVSRLEDWQQYPNGAGVFVDIDTRHAAFFAAPVYVCSLTGRSSHWETTGGGSVYNATDVGFRVYVRRPDGRPLSRQEAINDGWYINWIGQLGPEQQIN